MLEQPKQKENTMVAHLKHLGAVPFCLTNVPQVNFFHFFGLEFLRDFFHLFVRIQFMEQLEILMINQGELIDFAFHNNNFQKLIPLGLLEDRQAARHVL